jgi:hypothetical protein
MTRKCRTCLQVKPLIDFHKHSTYKDGIDTKCRKCTNLFQKQYRKQWGAIGDHKAKVRNLKKKYGITFEQYMEMVDDQGGFCAICRDPPPFVVDHCHVTGKVRGLLCVTCNLGLGGFRDNIKSLYTAIRYLEYSS